MHTVLSLAFFCLAGCGGGSGGSIPPQAAVATASPAASQAIALSFQGTSAAPLIPIAVGGGSRVSMVFDTGSAGLRVPIAALTGAVYTDTAQPISITLGDTSTGTLTLSGTVGTADVIVGGIDIGKAVPFQIVKQVTCNGQPCMVNPFAGSVGGIFGARPRIAEDGILYSLMSELPGNLGTGFIVSLYGRQPMVRAGLTPANVAGFMDYGVPTATLADGAPTWNQSAGGGLFPWCYTIADGTSTVGPACGTGVLSADSDGGPMSLTIATSSPPPFVTPQTVAPLPAGAQITATLGNITWTLPPAGACGPYNEINTWFGPSSALPASYVETNGALPFFTNDVLFDLKGGNFGMRPVPAGPPSFC